MKRFEKVLYIPDDWNEVFKSAGLDFYELKKILSYKNSAKWAKPHRTAIQSCTAVKVDLNGIWFMPSYGDKWINKNAKKYKNQIDEKPLKLDNPKVSDSMKKSLKGLLKLVPTNEKKAIEYYKKLLDSK